MIEKKICCLINMSGIAACAVLVACAQRLPETSLAEPIEPSFESADFCVSDQGDHYRVPRLAVAPDGSFFSLAQLKLGNMRDHGGKTMMVMKKSRDNGRSWSPEQPCAVGGWPVVDQLAGTMMTMAWHWPMRDSDGRLMTEQWMAEHPQEAKELGGSVTLFTSDDNGATWEKSADLTDQLFLHPSGKKAHVMGRGIQLSKEEYAGRLVYPARIYSPQGQEAMQNVLLYSDDHGATWQWGAPAQPGTGESEIVELNDGSVYMNSRYHSKEFGFRVWSVSHDGGETFSEFGEHRELLDPMCHGSVCRYPDRDGKSRLLFSNCATDDWPRNHILTVGRHSMSVSISYDEGKTWPVHKLIDAGPSAYSCITVAPDGTILLLYESGEKSSYEKLTLARFNMEWLENEAPDVEKEKVLSDTVLIHDGEMQADLFVLGDWEKGSDEYGNHVESQPGGKNAVYSDLIIGPQDNCRIKARLSIDNLEQAKPYFHLDANYDGTRQLRFNDGSGQIAFDAKVFMGAFSSDVLASTESCIQEGIPFDFELVCEKGVFWFTINGELIGGRKEIDCFPRKHFGTFGFWTDKAEMKVYEFSVLKPQ